MSDSQQLLDTQSISATGLRKDLGRRAERAHDSGGDAHEHCQCANAASSTRSSSSSASQRYTSSWSRTMIAAFHSAAGVVAIRQLTKYYSAQVQSIW